MTREEAIEVLTHIYCTSSLINGRRDIREAIRVAIEVLKAESTIGQVKVDVSINKPTERWDTCGLSENDILLDSGSRGERR